ncbi:MAG: DMT family transporter [Actinobacteria bacterium]|nr:MAG: DMT family transporter [Actinomycetota bacterium]
MSAGRFSRLAVSLALVAVAMVWGGTFVMVKAAVAAYPLYAFLGWRFTVASVAFVVLFPGVFKRFGPGTLRVGLLAGVLLTAGYVFQTWGLQGTSASKAAFITGMFVVITPVLQAVVLRRVPHAYALAGVGLAVVGMWLLTGGVDGWNSGDTRVLLCAVAYSAHMIVLGGLGRRHDAVALTLVQLATAAVFCGAVAAVVERPPLPTGGQLWLALAVTGVLASAVAFAVQTHAQRLLSPTSTALILVCEPAFGGLFGWWLGGDVFGAPQLAGAALILGGMVSAEALAMLRPRGASDARLEPAVEGPPVAELGETGG